ncbi:MAG: hypothetical protein ACRENN_07030 [Candidatus Eiseniibacteriota bacterium]
MKSVRMIVVAALAVAMSGLVASTARAGASAEAGGGFSGSFPIGDWGELTGFGLGLENSTTIFTDPTKPLGIRSGSSLMYNFPRTVDVPAANLAPGTALRTETANVSWWLGIGPTFQKHTGNARPFVYGTIGVNVSWIDSHLKGNVNGANYDATVGQTSTTFAWTAGAGLSKKASSVPGGRLGINVEYRSFVGQNYLLPGDVTSSGSAVFWDRSSRNADQIVVRIGIMNDV